jgi:hypothetical protein
LLDIDDLSPPDVSTLLSLAQPLAISPNNVIHNAFLNMTPPHHETESKMLYLHLLRISDLLAASSTISAIVVLFGLQECQRWPTNFCRRMIGG